MGRVRVVLSVAALALVVSASLVVLWPLSATGVSGSALTPRYHDFGFWSFEPLPRYATTTDLRHAGIRLPQDVVAHRRHIADGLAWGAVASVVVLSAAAFAEYRRRRT
jgi:hypothetical protein